MAQIAWTTPAGDLGTYPELGEFSIQLEAQNPIVGALTYTVVSGALPPGIQLYQSGTNAGLLYGIPNVTTPGEAVARRYKFTVRARNTQNQIADRSFSISINSLVPPIIVTSNESLGTYYNSDYVSIQLDYTETNPGTTLQWSISSGNLPQGLSLSQSGIISGFAEAPPSGGPAGSASYDIGRYDEFTWDFEGTTLNAIYQFSVRIFDGILYAEKTYKITILAKSYFRTDNILITADSSTTTDKDGYEYPSIITLPQELVPVRGDRYYSFQFKAYYPNPNIPVYWRVEGAGPALFDQGAVPNPDDNGNAFSLVALDEKSFDQSNLALPPGLVLDRESGWLSGGLGTVPSNKSSFTFKVVAYVEIPVSATEVSVRESQAVQYTIDLLADIDDFITWKTDSNLGSIDNGEISTLFIEATANRGQQLYYSIKSGRYSRLPQGLSLLSSGNLSGRTSFDFFSMDRSSVQVIMDDGTTTWDTIYQFTVLAQDAGGFTFDTKEFTLRVTNVNLKPFQNLYMKALIPKDLRERFKTTITNSTIIPQNIVYRPDDPYFGLAKDLKFLALPGLTASTFEKYIESMDIYHRNKKIKFGDLRLATAKDDNLNVKYEVIYVEVLDYNEKSNDSKSYNLSYFENPSRIQDSGSINTLDADPVNYGILNAGISTNQDYGIVSNLLNVKTQNISFSNSFGNMTGEIVDNIGYEYQGAIPDWMRTIQDDSGQALGFIKAVVLAYIKPGQGKKALFRYSNDLKSSGFSQLALLNQYAFEIDRYLLDRALTINYDAETQRFIKTRTTTFDRLPSIGVVDTGPWVRKNINSTERLKGVDFGAGELIAVGANATIISSTSGDLWTAIPQTIDLSYRAGIITAANIGDSQFNFVYGTKFSLGDEILRQGEYNASTRSYISDIDYYIRLSTPIVGEIPSNTTLEFITFNGTTFKANSLVFLSNSSSNVYFSDISNIERGYAVRIAGIDVDNFANVIIKNASTNELQLSRPLTNLIPAGTKITFDDLNGNVISLITSIQSANATSNLTFTSSTTNVKIGSFATLSNINVGTFVQALNTNVSVSQPCINAIPLGSELFFTSVITANAVAGDATINLSSTDRIGVGTSIFGDSTAYETSVTNVFWSELASPDTSLEVILPSADISGISLFVGMTLEVSGLPEDSRIVSISTNAANTVINVSFSSSTVTGNPIVKTMASDSITGPVSATIEDFITYLDVGGNVGIRINDQVISSNISLSDNIKVTGLLANGGILIDNVDSNVKVTSGESIYFLRRLPVKFGTESILREGTVISSKTATSVTLSTPLLANVNIGEDTLINFGLGEIDLNYVMYQSEWYAVGTRGAVLKREDGVWNQGYATNVGDLYGLAIGPGPVYIVVGNEGLIARSTDYINWTRINTGVIVDLFSVDYNDNYWVAVGSNGTILTSIDNGLTWTIDNTYTDKDIYSVKYLNNNWIAVGSKGLVLLSSDALFWDTYYAGVTFTLRDVSFIRNQYIAVGDKGIILESLDGTVWSRRLSYQTENILSIANGVNAPIVVGDNGLILVESNNFTVDYAIRNISFEMFNFNTLEDLAKLGYPVQEGSTLIFAQQEGFDPTEYRGESFQNDGWNAYEEVFGDESPELAFDSTPYDKKTVVPGYIANLLDSTVSNERAGIWRVALNSNGIAFLTFVRQIQFNQIITVLAENTKLVYDPDVPVGGSVPTFRLLTLVNNDSADATVFDNNSTRISEPRDQYLAEPELYDRYLKFPSTGVIS